VSRRYKNILPITIALHGWCVLRHQQGDQSFPEKKNFDAPFQASITASATLDPFGLAHSSSWRTEGSRGNLDGCQDRGEQRSRLLPKKPLRRGRAVRTREEEVMYGGQTCPLLGTIKASQL
jgi:hypothetical protein